MTAGGNHEKKPVGLVAWCCVYDFIYSFVFHRHTKLLLSLSCVFQCGIEKQYKRKWSKTLNECSSVKVTVAIEIGAVEALPSALYLVLLPWYRKFGRECESQLGGYHVTV